MEDAETVAFLDIHPLTNGHTLVIPREHAATVFELSPTAGEAVMRATIKVARALREQLQPDGLNLLQSNGRAAGQTVSHFHFHLVPRWNQDGLFLPHHPPVRAEQEVLAPLAMALREHL